MSEFTEVRTADLTGAALDYITAKAASIPMFEMGDNWPGNSAVTEATRVEPAVIRNLVGGLYFEASLRSVRWSPSTDWSQGGPLIEKYKVSVDVRPLSGRWDAYCSGWINDCESPLIAACRAIVASVLGDTVSVPKELCQ
jgi:hypothetical protein